MYSISAPDKREDYEQTMIEIEKEGEKLLAKGEILSDHFLIICMYRKVMYKDCSEVDGLIYNLRKKR